MKETLRTSLLDLANATMSSMTLPDVVCVTTPRSAESLTAVDLNAAFRSSGGILASISWLHSD